MIGWGKSGDLPLLVTITVYARWQVYLNAMSIDQMHISQGALRLCAWGCRGAMPQAMLMDF